MKKLIITCIISLLAVSISACSNSTNKDPVNTTKGGNAVENQVIGGPLDKYDPPIQVSAVRPITEGTTFKSGEDINNNAWSQAYEEMLGIKVNYDWTVVQSQYGQKLNISIASDDLPDIFQVTAAQLKKLVADNQLADLSELYETYASDFTKQILSEDGGNALESTKFDNKMMALPKMGSGIGQSHVLWIRTDWLKNLNLEEPKTMDDLFKIAEAFTNGDPDGNQKADTTGLAINRDLWGFYAALEGYFNGFHSYPNTWIEDNNGEIVHGSIQPETKQALIKLQEMFKAGQIDKEFGTRDATKMSEDANAGKVGMLYGYFWNSGWLQSGKLQDPNAEWKAIPLPSIDQQPAKAQVPFAINTYYVVKKDAKHPEAAIKMLNLVLEKIYGETSDPSKYNVDEETHTIFEYALLYGEAPLKNLNAHSHVVDAIESGDTSSLNQEELGYYEGVVASQSGDNNFWGVEKMYGPGGSLGVLQSYVDNQQIMDTRFYGAPTPAMVDKDSTLQKMQLETFTSIVMGGDISLFDKFVEDWKKLGGDQMTKEVNDWYTSK